MKSASGAMGGLSALADSVAKHNQRAAGFNPAECVGWRRAPARPSLVQTLNHQGTKNTKTNSCYAPSSPPQGCRGSTGNQYQPRNYGTIRIGTVFVLYLTSTG